MAKRAARPKPPKLYHVLDSTLHEAVPLPLLVSPRLPFSFTEFPLPYLIAVEFPENVAKRYARYGRGRLSS